MEGVCFGILSIPFICDIYHISFWYVTSVCIAKFSICMFTIIKYDISYLRTTPNSGAYECMRSLRGDTTVYMTRYSRISLIELCSESIWVTTVPSIIVRRARLMRSQQDPENWWTVPLTCAWLYMSFLLFCLICVYSSQFSISFLIMYLL